MRHSPDSYLRPSCRITGRSCSAACTHTFGQLLTYTDDKRTAGVPHNLPFTSCNLTSTTSSHSLKTNEKQRNRISGQCLLALRPTTLGGGFICAVEIFAVEKQKMDIDIQNQLLPKSQITGGSAFGWRLIRYVEMLLNNSALFP